MTEKIRLILIFLSLSCFYDGQTIQSDTTLLTDKQLKKQKVFSNIDLALKEPLKVIVLDLRGQNLDSLPSSISQFKNLQALYLGSKPKSTTPRRILRRAKKIGGGLMHLDRGTGKYIAYNRLTKLPASIAELKKLQIAIVTWNKLEEVPFVFAQLKNLKRLSIYGNFELMNKESEIKDLKSRLPKDCIFESGTSIDNEKQ